MKKSAFLNGLVILMALLPAAYLLFVWPSLPEIVPVHFGADMKPDRMGSKAELWLPTGILSLVSVLLYFLFNNLHRIDPKRSGTTPSPVFQKLAIGLVVFITALGCLIIGSVREGSSAPHFLFPLIGLLFAFIGSCMSSIEPNYFAGIRLPWTLSSDENWRRTHRLGSRLWLPGGLLIAVVCLFLAPPAAFEFFIAVTILLVLVPVVYSYRLFKKGA